MKSILETIQSFFLKDRERFKPFSSIRTDNAAGKSWTTGSLAGSVRQASVFATFLLTAYGIGCSGLAHAQTQVFGVSLGSIIENFLTVAFAAIAVIWVLVKRIDSVMDELKDMIFKNEIKNQKEHHELNLAINKVLWYLEGAKGASIPKPPNLTHDLEANPSQDS